MTRARDLAKGTFSGDLTVDTNTLVVDSANNRVGVGTASPDLSLDVTRSGDGDIAVFQTTANHGVVLSAPSSTTLQIASVQGSKNLDLWANTLSFSAGGTERLRILSTGGITFNGDTATANALDDYEEGSFTPTLGGTTTYNGAGGFYTKVGQVVSVQCFVNIASLNTPKNGNHYIQGLPFASSGQESYMGVHYFYNCAVNMSYLAFRATGYDMWPTFAGSPSGSMGVNPAIFQNNTQVYIAGVYRTTQ